MAQGSTFYCWGKNSVGELGLGHTNPVTEPTLFAHVKSQNLEFVHVVGGWSHTLALTGKGAIYSWEQGYENALSTGHGHQDMVNS